MTKVHVSLKSASEDTSVEDIKKSTPLFLVNPRIMAVKPGFNSRPVNAERVALYKSVWLEAKAAGKPDPFPPMKVRMVNGVPEILGGHHRHAMYMELIADGEPIERVRCDEFKGDDKEAILFMLGDNDGLGSTMMEVGVKYAELVNLYGMTFAEVAKKRGRSIQHVKDCIQLTEQNAEIKTAIADGAIAPAAALKLVKSHGATEATAVIKQARHDIAAGIKAPKQGKITQKVIDNLARSKVDEATVRGKQIKDHLSAMLESPSFPREVKDAIRKVMKAIGGRLPDHVKDTAEIDHVEEFLREARASVNDIVSISAKMLTKHRAKEFIPSNSSPESKYYGHMIWLQDMEADSRKPALRQGAAWFIALLDANRSDKPIAPPPSILALDVAIQTEIDSNGAATAESMCPEHAHLVAYLRSGKVQSN